MSMTDPIADFLTRIRNGLQAAHEDVVIPSSGLKAEMARILAEQGYIEGFDEAPGVPGSHANRAQVASSSELCAGLRVRYRPPSAVAAASTPWESPPDDRVEQRSRAIH